MQFEGPGRSKNSAKSKFTNLLLADAKFEDAYWQGEAIASYSELHGLSGLWQLRGLVGAQHGGGVEGHTAVA